MTVELHRAHVTGVVLRGHAQRAVRERVAHSRVEAIPAVIALGGFCNPVGGPQPRPGAKAYGAARLDEGTLERRHHESLSVRRRLRVLRVAPAEHVASVLDDRVLKSAARTEERHALLSCVADGAKGALHTVVRARWHAPERV